MLALKEKTLFLQTGHTKQGKSLHQKHRGKTKQSHQEGSWRQDGGGVQEADTIIQP